MGHGRWGPGVSGGAARLGGSQFVFEGAGGFGTFGFPPRRSHRTEPAGASAVPASVSPFDGY